MKKYDAISIVQVSLLIMTAIGLKNHVTVIPHLLAASKRDAWITVIFALLVIIVWSTLLLYIHKVTQPDNIFDWLKKQIGPKTKWILSIPTSIVFVLLAALSIKELVAWTKVTYLPFTPSFFTISLFVLLMWISCGNQFTDYGHCQYICASHRHCFWFFCSHCEYPI